MLFESAALIKTQLKHRYVSLGIQVAQDAPRAVIEAPGFIFLDGWIGRDLLGFLGSSGRGPELQLGEPPQRSRELSPLERKFKERGAP